MLLKLSTRFLLSQIFFLVLLNNHSTFFITFLSTTTLVKPTSRRPGRWGWPESARAVAAAAVAANARRGRRSLGTVVADCRAGRYGGEVAAAFVVWGECGWQSF